MACATLNNYGSLLQTYALQEVVRLHGFNPEIILYQEPVWRKLKRMKNIEYAKVSMGKLLLSKLPMPGSSLDKQKYKERANCFEEFRKSKLNFSETCRSMRDLRELANQYPLVLLGSDQLWQPMNLGMDFFTLSFVPENVIKGAYAASFGVSSIPRKMQDAYKNYIEKFDYVSCRENSGSRIVKELTGRDAPVVCDPTLLMTADEWNLLLSDKVKPDGKYIFCYFLGNNPIQREYVKKMKEELGLTIVALPHIVEFVSSDEAYADYLPYNVGPAEFLYLIKNAEFVCTDSFHASVFSLQFHRQFLVFDRFENGKGNSTTSRIETLLGVVGCQDRLVCNTANFMQINAKNLAPINYSGVDGKLKDFRKESMVYLKAILDNTIIEQKV